MKPEIEAKSGRTIGPNLSVNTIPIREQPKDGVEFVLLVWEAIAMSLREED